MYVTKLPKTEGVLQQGRQGSWQRHILQSIHTRPCYGYLSTGKEDSMSLFKTLARANLEKVISVRETGGWQHAH